MSTTSVIELSKPTIMVIDDTPENLTLMASLLQKEGFRPLVFPNGELAIKAAKKVQPDLILLDIMMPILSGFEVNEILKSDKELSQIPVLFISAQNDTNSKLKAFECGGLDYITKPFQSEEILARIKTHLELHSTKRKLQDIQKSLELEVFEKTADLRQAQKIACLGNWKVDLETGDIKWSEITYNIFGIATDTPINFEFYFSLIFGDDLEKAKSAWENFIENKDSNYELELRIKYKDSYKWILTIADFSFNEDNKPVAVIGTVKDITVRKNAEIQLENQNKALREIAWMQSHGIRALLTRLMALISLAQDDDFKELSIDVLFASMNETVNQIDELIFKMSEKLNQNEN